MAVDIGLREIFTNDVMRNTHTRISKNEKGTWVENDVIHSGKRQKLQRKCMLGFPFCIQIIDLWQEQDECSKCV